MPETSPVASPDAPPDDELVPPPPDIQRRSNPRLWVMLGLLAFDLVVPYGIGRHLALSNGTAILERLDWPPTAFAAIGWAASVAVFLSFALAILRPAQTWWRYCGIITFGIVQLLSGFCLLRKGFTSPTYVVFGDQADKANSVNVGIIAAVAGLTAYLLLFVVLLVFTPKQSRFARLTRGHTTLATLLAFQIGALAVVVFGNLLEVFAYTR